MNDSPRMNDLSLHNRIFVLFWSALLLSACAPNPQMNVAGYLLAKQLGTYDAPASVQPPGALTGMVIATDGKPIANATVLVAERTGTPYVARTGATGRYQIDGIPPGQYVPAAAAIGFAEVAAADRFGTPRLATIRADEVTAALPIALTPHNPALLPDPLLPAVNLTPLESPYIAQTIFPPDGDAQVHKFRFEWQGATVDTLRVYVPSVLSPAAELPLLFMVYPTHVDLWESVSIGFASQGYAFVAISPIAARGVDIDAHALDARIALTLAHSGALLPHISKEPAITLGGSFSSAILNRMLRDTQEQIAGWVTVGGIANAFTGAADFYAGRIHVPPPYEYAIPALGPPNVFPLRFLKYSPVYAAAQLPPTMIVHTDADLVTPITQAYDLEQALRDEGVPVETYYYADVSHYLQIEDDRTPEAEEMFWRILEFVEEIRDNL